MSVVIFTAKPIPKIGPNEFSLFMPFESILKILEPSGISYGRSARKPSKLYQKVKLGGLGENMPQFCSK